jgi:hypothetical protein
MTKKVQTLKIAVTQEHLSQQLMDELRAVVKQDKYDYLYDSTLVGVLEMLKWEYIQQNKEG